MLITACLRLVPLGEVVESAPALATLNVVKFFKDFFFGVTSLLDDSPEILELSKGHLAVSIHINCLKELLG